MIIGAASIALLTGEQGYQPVLLLDHIVSALAR
jgi:recombinational DNA repair ATPase RecF